MFADVNISTDRLVDAINPIDLEARDLGEGANKPVVDKATKSACTGPEDPNTLGFHHEQLCPRQQPAPR
ncbi:unnamed protein product [Parnassius mnemosyne]|uniref:Uncharacterized protein n=1 Tax=Parnassius mnemosyne TaxID=213953 RepID=A0AAV1M7N7_9NEOP